MSEMFANVHRILFVRVHRQSSRRVLSWRRSGHKAEFNMRDIKKKIVMLRQFYSPQRYASNPLEYQRLQKIVVEGRDQQFVGLVGFPEQSAWSKRCSGEVRFTELELKRMAKFFHLDEIVNEGEQGWQLLTDRIPHEHFVVRLVEKGYGTLRAFRGEHTKPVTNPTRVEFLHPLLSFAAGNLDIEVIEVAAERGAAEQHELQEHALLRLLAAWTPYAYRVTAEQDISGDLYVLEISSAIDGDCASCMMVAPSKLHGRSFFTSPTMVPEAKGGTEIQTFKMSDKSPRCTTVAIVTAQPLRDLPVPGVKQYFTPLSVEHLRLLATQVTEMASSVMRGTCTLGLC
jgi:hypothetical protein